MKRTEFIPDPCPLCNSTGHKPIYITEQASVIRCQGCGLVRTLDATTQTGLEDLYDEDYALSQPFAPEGRDREIMERPLALALEHAPPPARLLEIGVGQGWLLKRATEKGYNTLGADLSPAGAARAEKSSGVKVLAGELARLSLAESSFEAVLIRHTLEHIQDPLSFLKEIRRLLAPGGILAGAVPNFGSLKRRLDGLDWLFLTLPHHRFHYTRKTLASVLEKAGFKVQNLRTAEHMAHHRALFQVALNRLRRMTDRPPAPTNYDPREVRVTSLPTWALAQEYRVHHLLARLGWGEELIFIARKP